MSDRFDLHRFVEAQDCDGAYADAVRELRAGRKESHWMWFVFPQIQGLGHSPMAQLYAISGRAEAEAYLAHPILGERLRECAGIVAALDSTDAVEIFGPIDTLKLHSSMTLFHLAAPDERAFKVVLAKYFDGVLDEGTTSRLTTR